MWNLRSTLICRKTLNPLGLRCTMRGILQYSILTPRRLWMNEGWSVCHWCIGFATTSQNCKGLDPWKQYDNSNIIDGVVLVTNLINFSFFIRNKFVIFLFRHLNSPLHSMQQDYYDKFSWYIYTLHVVMFDCSRLRRSIDQFRLSNSSCWTSHSICCSIGKCDSIWCWNLNPILHNPLESNSRSGLVGCGTTTLALPPLSMENFPHPIELSVKSRN